MSRFALHWDRWRRAGAVGASTDVASAASVRAAARLVTALACVAVVSACGGDAPTTPSPPPAPFVDAVTVSGWLSPLALGQSVQLSAFAVRSDGSTFSITTEATWQSSNVTVAIVSPVGLVTALTGGRTDIRATYQSRTGTLPMT